MFGMLIRRWAVVSLSMPRSRTTVGQPPIRRRRASLRCATRRETGQQSGVAVFTACTLVLASVGACCQAGRASEEGSQETPRFGFPDAVSADGREAGPHILSLDKGIEFLARHNLPDEARGETGLSDYFWSHLDRIGKRARAMGLFALLAAEPAFSIP